MSKLLKLTAVGMGALTALGLVGYGLQTERVIENRFALKEYKSSYQNIIQTNTSLNVEARSAVNLGAVEQKIAEANYVAVNEISFIAVPYDLLARKGR